MLGADFIMADKMVSHGSIIWLFGRVFWFVFELWQLQCGGKNAKSGAGKRVAKWRKGVRVSNLSLFVGFASLMQRYEK